jgi:hypothetical protein
MSTLSRDAVTMIHTNLPRNGHAKIVGPTKESKHFGEKLKLTRKVYNPPCTHLDLKVGASILPDQLWPLQTREVLAFLPEFRRTGQSINEPALRTQKQHSQQQAIEKILPPPTS